MEESNGMFEMVATTLQGMEDVLAAELLRLGAQEIQPGVRMVKFSGDLGFLYKANFGLRLAIRILRPITSFKVRNEKELYRKINEIEWENYMDVEQTMAVSAVVTSQVFKNSHYIQLLGKDAIVDRFRDRSGKRPNIDKETPQIGIHIHVNRENVDISLDSSGAPLFKRGYRNESVMAPMSEVLAAGLLALADWEGQANFIDPMCGSGTFLTEAAMMALNIPAQIKRTQFSFQFWKDYDETLFNTIREGLLKRIRERPIKFIGYDTSERALTAARSNIEALMLEDYITVSRMNFFKTTKPIGPTFLMFNPPYGERLPVPEDFYKNIGDTLKQGYAGSTAWMITSDFEGLKSVGLRTARRIPMKNAKLECKLVRYDLYEGTKKVKDPDSQIRSDSPRPLVQKKRLVDRITRRPEPPSEE